MYKLSALLVLLPLAGTAQAQETTPLADQERPETEVEAPIAGPSDPQAAAADAAEDADELAEEAEADEEIVVTGRRERGAVLGDIEPEVQLDRRDIRALGAGNLAELLEAVAPQVRGGRGRGGEQPVILLNGRRISSFAEIRNLPPEAVIRVDILPEETALRYGYRADQRVVNFVLRRRFRAITSELEYGLPTAGGRSSYEADINILRLNRQGRWSLDFELERDSPLFESEREIIQSGSPDAFDTGPFRTLLPERNQMTLGGTFNRTILGDVSATVNARFEGIDTTSRFGLPMADLDAIEGMDVLRPLTRESRARNAHLGATLNGEIAPWLWSFTGNYDRNTNLTLTDRDPEIVSMMRQQDRSRTTTSLANAEMVANGPLFSLPAGPVAASLKIGAETRGLRGETERLDFSQERELGRNRASGQASFDIPIASRRRDVLGAIGDLSANFNLAYDYLSDFGALRTLGYGLNWSPIPQLDLLASVTDEDGAPTMQQLGEPTLVTPNFRVFDFLRGETVDITRIEGGSPDLRADNRRVLNLRAQLRPFSQTDLSLSANYTKTRILNPIASFPTATPELEAAFPDRFVRGADGRLVSIDARPVNFARSDREQIRWGINYSRSIGPERPAGARNWRRELRRGAGGQGGDAAGAAPPGPDAAAQSRGRRGGGGRGFGRGRGGFGPGGGGGRLQFALYYTWRIKDSILIREGLPELDLLNGSAVGSTGGRPRHEIEAQTGIFRGGLGARLTANWQSGTFVRGGPDGQGGTRGDLNFSGRTTVNLRLFADLGQQRALVTKYPILRGTRVSLAVTNIFNSGIDVRDEAGLTPISYQPAYLDPLGRSVRLSIRKLFF